MVLATAMSGTGGLTDELFNEVGERGSLCARFESASSASMTTNQRCSSSIRDSSRSQRRARLVSRAKGMIAGFVGPCIANALNDEDNPNSQSDLVTSLGKTKLLRKNTALMIDHVDRRSKIFPGGHICSSMRRTRIRGQE